MNYYATGISYSGIRLFFFAIIFTEATRWAWQLSDTVFFRALKLCIKTTRLEGEKVESLEDWNDFFYLFLFFYSTIESIYSTICLGVIFVSKIYFFSTHNPIRLNLDTFSLIGAIFKSVQSLVISSQPQELSQLQMVLPVIRPEPAQGSLLQVLVG